MKILLLGVGMQGRVALYDLVGSPGVKEIIAADADVAKLQAHVDAQGWGHKVRCLPVDGADPASLDRLMALKPDVAIDLLPAVFFPTAARAAIARGVHLINSNYIPPELRALDETARVRGVTVLPEFGLDPGLDLVMLGDAVQALVSHASDFPPKYGKGAARVPARLHLFSTKKCPNTSFHATAYGRA